MTQPRRIRRLTLAGALAVATAGGAALVHVEGADRTPAAYPNFVCVAVGNAVGFCVGPPTAS